MQPPSPSQDPTIKPEVRSFRLFAICLLFLGLLLAGSGWAWRHSPVGPMDHFARGQLLIVPAMVAPFSLAALPKPERFRARWRFSSRGLLPGWLPLFLLYAAEFHLVIILGAVGRPVHSPVQWMLGPIGLFYICLGNNLSKSRDEFFFRIRTPWTIRSELSWNRTNRFGAWMYVVGGLSICVCTLAGVSARWLAILVGAFGLGSTAIFQGYSYVLWRRDPEKTALKRSDQSDVAERKKFALGRLIFLAVLGVAFVGFGMHNFGSAGVDWFSVGLGALILGYGICLFQMDRKCREWALMRSIFLTVLGVAFVCFGAHMFGGYGAPFFVLLGGLLFSFGIFQFYTATKCRDELGAQKG